MVQSSLRNDRNIFEFRVPVGKRFVFCRGAAGAADFRDHVLEFETEQGLHNGSVASQPAHLRWAVVL